MKTIINTAAILILLMSTVSFADSEVTALSAKQQLATLEKDSKVEFPIVKNPVDLMGKPIIVSTASDNGDNLLVPARYKIISGK